MLNRSYLFVPANRPERFDKALAAGPDAVIIDLEDAVPAEDKDRARGMVADWLSETHPVHIRINGSATPWFEQDLKLAMRAGVAGVLLPKAESGAQVEHVAARVRAGTRILPLVETAVGAWNVLELAKARAVERLAFGSLDMQLDIGAGDGDEALLYTRSRLVLASRVAGILPPVDGVTVDFRDQGRLRADIRKAKNLGFAGKLCIHPAQVAAVNDEFIPSPAEVEWARKVLAAAEAARGAAVQVDGKMVDRPVILRAQIIFSLAGHRKS